MTNDVIRVVIPEHRNCPNMAEAYQSGYASITGDPAPKLTCFCSDCRSAYYQGQHDGAKMLSKRKTS